MYTDWNFKTKKALKDAVANGEKITVYQPGPFGGNEPANGDIALEGPHYPAPHTWYASATLQNGIVVRVDGKIPKASAPKPARVTKPREWKKGRIAFGCNDLAHWCGGCPRECFA